MSKVTPLQPATEEVVRFRSLLTAYGLSADAFSLREVGYEADLGPPVRLMLVSGPTHGRYSKTDGDWLGQLEKDLRAGLYA